MNVLSLFDGMSCGQIALERCGIKVDKYFASEIKKHAIKVTKHNYPDTIHIGDVTKVRYSNGILHTESDSYEINIDLLLGGSPCQDLSRMNTTVAGLLGEKSRLFWEYHRIYTEIKRENPNMYFLFENVASAPADDLAIISKAFGGILGVRINSALVSAQMRDRIYWTNISGTAIDLFGNSCIAQPEDKHIYLKDIIEDGYVFIDKMGCLLANHAKSYVRQDMFTLSDYLCRRRRSISQTGFPIVFLSNDPEIRGDNIRLLYRSEFEKLQTINIGYTDCLSYNQAINVIGDGWNIDTVCHILKGLKA